MLSHPSKVYLIIFSESNFSETFFPPRSPPAEQPLFSLHFMGLKDKLVPPAASKKLADLFKAVYGFENSLAKVHLAGHIIPVGDIIRAWHRVQERSSSPGGGASSQRKQFFRLPGVFVDEDEDMAALDDMDESEHLPEGIQSASLRDEFDALAGMFPDRLFVKKSASCGSTVSAGLVCQLRFDNFALEMSFPPGRERVPDGTALPPQSSAEDTTSSYMSFFGPALLPGDPDSAAAGESAPAPGCGLLPAGGGASFAVDDVVLGNLLAHHGADSDASQNPAFRPRIRLLTDNWEFETKLSGLRARVEACLAESCGETGRFEEYVGQGVAVAFAAEEWEREVLAEFGSHFAASGSGTGGQNGIGGILPDEEVDDVQTWWDQEDIDQTVATEIRRHLSKNPFVKKVSPRLGSCSAQRVWKFVVGLVGKPSAGKSTLFNALCPEGGGARAETAAHPFTTIDPNIATAWAKLWLSEDGRVGPRKENSVELKLPCVLKDVAGLVPGAWQGRGRGNSFLNDLLDADALLHVVDLSGRLDECGNVSGNVNQQGAAESSTDNADPTFLQTLRDTSFIQHELWCWIFSNVRSKWSSVRKLSTQTDSSGRGGMGSPKALDRFCGLLTGYHCTRGFVLACVQELGRRFFFDCFDAAGRETLDTTDSGRGRSDLFRFHRWTERDLSAFVAIFIEMRFPMVLACNKADVLEAAEVGRRCALIAEAVGGAVEPVSGKEGTNVEVVLARCLLAASPMVVRVWGGKGENIGDFLLPSGSRVFDVFETLKTNNLLSGEFVRAEDLRKNGEMIKKDCCLEGQFAELKIMAKRKSCWQKK